jgi:hypothetical protein
MEEHSPKETESPLKVSDFLSFLGDAAQAVSQKWIKKYRECDYPDDTILFRYVGEFFMHGRQPTEFHFEVKQSKKQQVKPDDNKYEPLNSSSEETQEPPKDFITIDGRVYEINEALKPVPARSKEPSIVNPSNTRPWNDANVQLSSDSDSLSSTSSDDKENVNPLITASISGNIRHYAEAE